MPLVKIKKFLSCLCALAFGLDNGRISHDDVRHTDKSSEHNSVDWKGLCKSGTRQSPINLPVHLDYQRTKRVKLEFNEHYCSDEFWIAAYGHTIRVTLKPEPTSSGKMSGYKFSNPYIFAEIHFHWSHDSKGSEHAIDNKFFAMEAHLVHYNSKYDSCTAAVNSGDPNGIAVVAVFIAEGNDSDFNSGFHTIATNILKIGRNRDATHVRQRIELSTFLPGNGQHFYRYSGSLTTLDCNEIVEWTVVRDPIRVSPTLIQIFRDATKSTTRHIGDNVRPIQELGHRNVEYLAKK